MDNSASGKFGWTVVEDVPVPFIYRGDITLAPVRILEQYVFKKFENILSPEVFQCVQVDTYIAHAVEIRLLNEINVQHCDQLYGNNAFTNSDTLIPVAEVLEYSKFLNFVINKLSNNENVDLTRCGFYKLNQEAVVPYVKVNGEVFLPTFYFEGEIESLVNKPQTIDGWDVAYLKFCCKIQAIKESLYNKDTHCVLKLDDIMTHFPSPQTFECHWPNEIQFKMYFPLGTK